MPTKSNCVRCGVRFEPLSSEQFMCADCYVKEQRKETGSETINHPAHYGGDTTYEAIKVIEAWGLGFLDGTVLKYICRQGKKRGDRIEDLKKARWYLDRLIKNLERIEG